MTVNGNCVLVTDPCFCDCGLLPSLSVPWGAWQPIIWLVLGHQGTPALHGVWPSQENDRGNFGGYGELEHLMSTDLAIGPFGRSNPLLCQLGR